MIKDLLDKKAVPYEVVDAEENISLTKKYDIMQAPTLVAVNDNGAELYPNASNIIRFVNEKTRA
jgi:ribonucleoside-triphosphate reductase